MREGETQVHVRIFCFDLQEKYVCQLSGLMLESVVAVLTQHRMARSIIIGSHVYTSVSRIQVSHFLSVQVISYFHTLVHVPPHTHTHTAVQTTPCYVKLRVTLKLQITECVYKYFHTI